VQAAVQEHCVPEAIRSLTTFEPLDYVDLFVAPAEDAMGTSAEEWARAAIEGAPAVGRFLAWQVCCALRLQHAPSSDRIAGWSIAGRGSDWIRLEAESWFMTAQMVFRVERGRVSFATFIRYDRPIAALIWGMASIAHRQVAPGFVHGAVRRVARMRRATSGGLAASAR
jgi:hypothetical protein